MPTQEKFYLNNNKNLKLSLLLNKPEEHNSKLPVVLILHGFSGFKEEEHLESIAKSLCEKNILSLRFDCSGFGESEGNTEDDYRVSNYLEEIELTLNWLSQQKFIDSERIGITGHSLGGGLALIATAKHSIIKACVPIQPSRIKMEHGGNYDLDSWKSTGWFEKVSEHPTRKIFRLPWSFALDRNQYSTLDYCPNVTKPVLLLYGDKDEACPADSCLEIFSAISGPKEAVCLEGYTHHFKSDPIKNNFVAELVSDFFISRLTQ